MNGIYFDITTEDITMVASDGHKLVRCKTLAAKGNERAAFILPKKPASLIKNLLPKEQGQVVIEFDERNAVFTLEKYRMVCRLIEGRYPNYNSVIPQNNPYKVTVDRMQLVGALRRVSIFSSQASSLIKLRMQPNQIVISAQDIDFSTSAEETLACQYDGNPMSIGFKSTFLIDILNNIAADEVIIELADPSRAGVIIPVTGSQSLHYISRITQTTVGNQRYTGAFQCFGNIIYGRKLRNTHTGNHTGSTDRARTYPDFHPVRTGFHQHLGGFARSDITYHNINVREAFLGLFQFFNHIHGMSVGINNDSSNTY